MDERDIAEFDVASARLIAATVRRSKATPRNTPTPPPPDEHDSDRWVSFVNNSGETVPAYGIMAVTGMTIESDANNLPIYEIDKPGSTFCRTYMVNGPFDVDAGDGELGTFQGPADVLYDSGFGTPAFGDGCGPKSGQWSLSKGYSGCSINGIVDSTDKIASVSLDFPLVEFVGYLDGSLSQGGSATVSLWTSGASAPATGVDTGWNVTAYDFLMKSGATAIASGKKVLVRYIGNAWYVVEAECS